MLRPKWLNGWKNKKILEASLTVDIADIKVVEAKFDEKLAFIAVATKLKIEFIPDHEKKDESRTDLEWRIFYDPTTIPDNMPLEKAKTLMSGIVALCSGSTSVYSASSKYIAHDTRPSKGNAPLLLDYDLAKKMQEAKNKESI